ncbi:hypothetical protein [Nocardia sp. XZ_19_385]|uniref:hypothetical protein n=1 Tax=Nocardia sp. XZ_19_385 TaxID=2769488 RepID=UPI00188F0113|nr:hypothetical protein [Nocardia sp. XZ_19_385]
MPGIRYPPRSEIDRILPILMAKRIFARVEEPPELKLVHLWALASDDTADQHLAWLPVDLDVAADGPSPILRAAEQLSLQSPTRLWGFGLAYCSVGELFLGPEGPPQDAVHAAYEGRLRERHTADDICAATIFDARGRAFNCAIYTHMPELGPTNWDDNTLKAAKQTQTWIRHFHLGVISAHVWVAALALDPDRNRNLLKRLIQHTS